MPKSIQSLHPQMRLLPAALRERMAALGHSQMEVSALTGVPQPQVSRALGGGRKRLTPAMMKLCRYALLDADKTVGADDATQEAIVLMCQLIGDSALAAAHMNAVLRSLAPLMENYRQRTFP